MIKSEFIQVSYLGGIPPRIHLQCKSLRKFGYKVRVMTHSSNQSLGSSYVDYMMGINTPILGWLSKTRVPKATRILLGHIEYISRLTKQLTPIVKPGDIVQLNHPLLLALVPLLRSKKVLIYYDAFEFYTVMFRNTGLLGRAFSVLCEKLENRYVPVLDGVFCVTSRNNWLKKRLMPLHRKIVELWNLPSLDQSINKELTNEIRRQFFGRELIAYIGGLKAHKGLTIFPDLVRQVARGYSRAHFLIIGKVQTDADVETWLHREGIREHCTHVPWVLPNVMNTYLSEAVVGLVLSPPSGIHLLVGPGNGRKMFTYMAAGLPVVAPKHGSAWDLVTSEMIGLQVDTTRAEDIANGVLTLLEQRELREQMANKAKSLFVERYNWECQEEKYIELFQPIK